MRRALVMGGLGRGRVRTSFSPTDIAGLNLWLKADGVLWQDSARTTPVTADGDPVGSWDDASGNGNHYPQATSLARPIYKTNIANGKPVLRFDGVTHHFDGPNHVASLTAGTVFIVVKVDADPPVLDAQTGFWVYGTSGSDIHLPYSDGGFYDDWGTTVRKTSGNPTLSFASAFRVYCVTSTAGNWTSYVNNTQHYTTASNTVGFTTTPLLGRSLSAAISLDGDVAEVAIYNSVLSTPNLTNFYNYAAAKYGL